ncbi:MAG: DHHA1 domain-containing protein, partial [Candidatus Omnitrophota bacterium]
YELLIQMKAVVTREIASCLLTSIIIDTGFFRFANIRPKTFDICSRLIKTGVELRELVEEAYWKKSVPTARLMGYCFSKVRLYDDGSIACADVSQRTLKRFKAKLSDLDNVADELRSIEGVRVAVLMRQTEKRSVRASLRSIGSLNVAGVAKQFGGGGHHNSAGCRLSDTPREKARFLAAVRELLRA